MDKGIQLLKVFGLVMSIIYVWLVFLHVIIPNMEF
jgi:hypothetical protein